jgi:hypothetical protein
VGEHLGGAAKLFLDHLLDHHCASVGLVRCGSVSFLEPSTRVNGRRRTAPDSRPRSEGHVIAGLEVSAHVSQKAGVGGRNETFGALRWTTST